MPIQLLPCPTAESALFFPNTSTLGLVMAERRHDVTYYGMGGRERYKDRLIPACLLISKPIHTGALDIKMLVLGKDGQVSPFTGGNTYDWGGICWGNVAPPRSTREAWTVFWESSFNNDLIVVPERKWSREAFERHMAETAGVDHKRELFADWMGAALDRMGGEEYPVRPHYRLTQALRDLKNKWMERIDAHDRAAQRAKVEFERLCSILDDHMPAHQTDLALTDLRMERSRHEAGAYRIRQKLSGIVPNHSQIRRACEDYQQAWRHYYSWRYGRESWLRGEITEKKLRRDLGDRLSKSSRKIMEELRRDEGRWKRWNNRVRQEARFNAQYQARQNDHAYSEWAMAERKKFLGGWWKEEKWKEALNFQPLNNINADTLGECISLDVAPDFQAHYRSIHGIPDSGGLMEVIGPVTSVAVDKDTECPECGESCDDETGEFELLRETERYWTWRCDGGCEWEWKQYKHSQMTIDGTGLVWGKYDERFIVWSDGRKIKGVKRGTNWIYGLLDSPEEAE